MNKLIKLPLFLGVCGGVCAGILAGVYAFTNPIILENAEKKANQAYYDTFKEFGNENTLVIDKTLSISDNLKNLGVVTKASVTTTGLNGMVYSCEVVGSATAGGNIISFQLAFANGKYYHYTNISNSETPTYGGSIINNMNSYINGLDASTPLSSVQSYIDAISGSTQTGKALSNTIDACAADYAASLN